MGAYQLMSEGGSPQRPAALTDKDMDGYKKSHAWTRRYPQELPALKSALLPPKVPMHGHSWPSSNHIYPQGPKGKVSPALRGKGFRKQLHQSRHLTKLRGKSLPHTRNGPFKRRVEMNTRCAISHLLGCVNPSAKPETG